jgi:squalene cyclase
LSQLEDGSWHDLRWHFWDATSVSVGTLIFLVYEPWATPAHREALAQGTHFIIEGQQPDGGWYSELTASPVDTTAHLLQKCILLGVSESVTVPAVELLLSLQHADGYWDGQNVDHTCDAIRCLMLAASSDPGKQYALSVLEASNRALSWLMSCAVDGGVGAYPDSEPNVLFTCDAIDTVLKFQLFHSAYADSTMVSLYR